MTALGWLAVLGPIVGVAIGLGFGFGMGVAHNAEEVGQLGERCEALERQVEEARAQIRAASAAPPSRRESGRVLDLVAPPSPA